MDARQIALGVTSNLPFPRRACCWLPYPLPKYAQRGYNPQNIQPQSLPGGKPYD